MTRALFSIIAVAVMARAQGLPVPTAGNVALPLDEYNRLLDLSSKPAKKPERPPLAYVLQCAELKLAVVGEFVKGTLTLDGEVFQAGPVKVPLIAGLTILDAQLKGSELALTQEGGAHVAVLGGPGAFAIALDVGLPLTVEPGRASIQLPAPAAGTVRLSLSIPGDHTQVNLSPGLIASLRSGGGRTLVDATLAPGQPVIVWWATRETAAPPAAPKPARFLSDVKTLVTVGEAEIAIAALVDLTVVQGEAASFEVEAPEGYEITGATGASLESSEIRAGVLTLKVGAARSHQFLISMVSAMSGSKTFVPLPRFRGSQRETGEVLVEGEGAMELVATESGGLKRMDLKEVSPYLRSLAHDSPQAAFRYHRQAVDVPTVSLQWVRFPDSKVLAAVGQRAVVTTLVTAEGKSLTEVRLIVKNQAQPFLKVALPAGASIVSADVAGEMVKPVQGADGNRVPLLRAGFRPAGTYPVSFVFLHSGAPFARKGGSELALPKMDVPIGLVEWEVFLPPQYKVRDFGGDAIAAGLMAEAREEGDNVGLAPPAILAHEAPPVLLPGSLGGIALDATGAVIPSVRVTVVHPATGTKRVASSDMSGRWLVTGVPSGKVKITAESAGFNQLVSEMEYNAMRPVFVSLAMDVGGVNQSVEVRAEAATLQTQSSEVEQRARRNASGESAASANVTNLQRRMAGVLPIAVDVPRAGRSFRFVRPLVMDEETRITFNYRR